MKKLLTLSLAALLSIALLSGCASTPPADDNADGDAVTLQILDASYAIEEYAICIAKENEELLAEVNTALAEVIADGTAEAIIAKYIEGTAHDLVFQADTEGKEELFMATNAAFPPYEFYEGDKIVGIDADIAAAIADKLDRKLVIEHMEFDSIIAAVSGGKSDIGMAAMTVTEDRLQSISFSESYATGIQVIIVPEGSPITDLDVLTAEGAEYLVGVQLGTTGDIYASGDFGDRVKKFPKGADAVQALVNGQIDCIIIDNEPAKAFVAANND